MNRSGPQRGEGDLAGHELTHAGFEIAILLGQLREEAERDRRRAELGDARPHAGQGPAEFGELLEVQAGSRAKGLRDLRESLQPSLQPGFGLGEVGPITEGPDDAEGLGGQTQGLLPIDPDQRKRTGDDARHPAERRAQGKAAQELVQGADGIGLRQRVALLQRIQVIARHEHELAMRGVDAPLEGRFAKPSLDVFELRIRPAGMIADHVEPKDAEHLEGGHASGGQFEQCLDQVADGGFAESLEPGRAEGEGGVARAQHAGQQGGMNLGGRREDQDIALPQAGQRGIGERGQNLVAHDLGLAPGAVAAVKGERGVGRLERHGRGLKVVDPGMEATQQGAMGGAAMRRQEDLLIGGDEVDDLLLLQGVVLAARPEQPEGGAPL
ncbi:MAG: hypothetical protein RI910_872 [Verrucomicrobiota bacterium]